MRYKLVPSFSTVARICKKHCGSISRLDLTLLTGKSKSLCSRMVHPSGSCTRHWSRTQGFSLFILTSWRKAPKFSSVKRKFLKLEALQDGKEQNILLFLFSELKHEWVCLIEKNDAYPSFWALLPKFVLSSRLILLREENVVRNNLFDIFSFYHFLKGSSGTDGKSWKREILGSFFI
jgi:hypothetical protein